MHNNTKILIRFLSLSIKKTENSIKRIRLQLSSNRLGFATQIFSLYVRHEVIRVITFKEIII